MTQESRITRVFWKPQEWEHLAVAVDEIRCKQPGISKLEALQRAQVQLLAVERRRTIQTWAIVRDRLEPLLEKARERRHQAQADAVPTPPVKSEAEIRQEKLQQWVATTAELFAPVLVQLLQQPAVAQEVRRIAASVAPIARPLLDTFAASFSPSAPTPDKLPRPKVLVAGLLPAQANEVCSSLAELVEFRFWGTDESKDKLKALARNCAVAVGVTDFLSHSAEASMKSLAPKYVRHSGGISRLKETLRGVVAEASRVEQGLTH